MWVMSEFPSLWTSGKSFEKELTFFQSRNLREFEWPENVASLEYVCVMSCINNC